MISRSLASDRYVAALGNISRDLFAITNGDTSRFLYCLGSMGSVIPLSLGLSLSKPSLRFNAIEGDGSLIMNLGCLLTVRRFGRGNLRIFLLDNRCYESTGKQESQPAGFLLEKLISSVGLHCLTIDTVAELESALEQNDLGEPCAIVIKIAATSPAGRIRKPPALMLQEFTAKLST
jgi:thiamine pyrophosphate-dependent acetolactate synthase large subunit-like protein